MTQRGGDGMKKIIMGTIFLFMVGAFFSAAAQADELAELKEQIEMMREQLNAQSKQMTDQAKQIEGQRRQIDVMQDKIMTLGPRKMAGTQGTSGPLEERVESLEKKFEEPWPSRLLSLKGKKVNFGGELELEFVDSQSDNATADSNPRFQIDKFVFKTDAVFTEDVSFYGEVEFSDSSVKLKQAYARFMHLPFDVSLRTGLAFPYIEVDRKTETNPINATAFGFRDTNIGLFAEGPLPGPLYWKGSVTNGFQLTTKSIGEDSAYAIIHESDDANDNNKNKEVSFALGVDKETDDIGAINLMGFGSWGKISDEDKTFLQGLTGYGASENEDVKSKAGVNVIYGLGDFTLTGQYIHAIDGDLTRDGWFLQPSYKFNGPEWAYFNAYEFVFRYNSLDVSLDDVFSDTSTWDRQTYTFALITEVTKNVLVKTEYNVNAEETGDGDVNNNEFLTQLEVKF